MLHALERIVGGKLARSMYEQPIIVHELSDKRPILRPANPRLIVPSVRLPSEAELEGLAPLDLGKVGQNETVQVAWLPGSAVAIDFAIECLNESIHLRS